MPSRFLPSLIGFVAFIFLGSAMLHLTKLLEASMEFVDSKYNCTARRKGCGGYGGSVDSSDHFLQGLPATGMSTMGAVVKQALRGRAPEDSLCQTHA